MENNADFGNFRLFKGDKVLWVIIAILSIISVLLVFSSTAKMAYDVTESQSSLRFLITQLGYMAISLFFVVALHHLSVNIYRRIKWWIWGTCAFLTLLAYFVGSTTNGAARWLPLGPIRVQPSDFMKVATVLHLSAMLTLDGIQVKKIKLLPSLKKKAGKKTKDKSWHEGALKITMPILLSVGLILTAHTSSAIMVFIISLLLLLIAGVDRKEIGKFVLFLALLGGIYSLFGLGRSGTAGGRVETWFATWFEDRSEIKVDYISDTERSMVAIQNGGLLGQGAGQSSMRVEMIHPESDYAFAFFVEEYGVILSVLLLLMYLWVFFRAMWIYERCRDPFKELLVLGLATLILVQAMLHVMVSVNFLPETGQILPLVSRGGSALFATYMAFMLMLSISVKCES